MLSRPHVFNIPSGYSFLEQLATTLLSDPSLSGLFDAKTRLQDYTILLPTRRAVRNLQNLLLQKSGTVPIGQYSVNFIKTVQKMFLIRNSRLFSVLQNERKHIQNFPIDWYALRQTVLVIRFKKHIQINLVTSLPQSFQNWGKVSLMVLGNCLMVCTLHHNPSTQDLIKALL